MSFCSTAPTPLKAKDKGQRQHEPSEDGHLHKAVELDVHPIGLHSKARQIAERQHSATAADSECRRHNELINNLPSNETERRAAVDWSDLFGDLFVILDVLGQSFGDQLGFDLT